MRVSTAIAVVALLAAAVPGAAEVDPSLQRVLDAKTLKVGIAVNAPWIIRKPDGSLVGYEIDLAKALAKDLGVTAQFVEMPFTDLLGRLNKGDVDIVASGLAITPERARSAVFSRPTGVNLVRTVAAIPAPAIAGTARPPEFAGPGYRIAVMAGSTGEAAARASFPKATVTAYPSMHDATAALVGGSAQAMVATSPVPRLAASLYNGKLRLVGRPLTRTAEAFALRPSDDRLRAFVDNWVEARVTDGTVGNLRGYWFFGSKWLGDLEPARPAAAAKK